MATTSDCRVDSVVTVADAGSFVVGTSVAGTGVAATGVADTGADGATGMSGGRFASSGIGSFD